MPKLPQTCAEPFWSTTDGRHVRLYHGNVTDVLARLPEKSIHCCVTSPPFEGALMRRADTSEMVVRKRVMFYKTGGKRGILKR